MEVRVLGALVLDEGRIRLAPRDRAVLAALTVRLGASVSVESLATALWGDHLPASWSKVIPGCVMRLRRAIAPAVVETTAVGYRLLPGHLEVDAEQFEKLVARGAQQLELGDPDRAAHTFTEALAMWRGDPLPELVDWPPARIAADRLQEMRDAVEEQLLEARLQAGDVQEVAAMARARVAEAPLRERRWVVLALAQYRQGRQADALSTVRRARGLLNAELGLDPGTELAELEQAILRQDASLLSERVFRVASPECPYFGLPPAGLADADRYFGREQELARALRVLEEDGVLLVSGSSGVGKSSFVRAGIGADVIARGREVAIVTPGQHPIESIHDVPLTAGDSLLIVDQCEEVFAAEDPAEIREFFETLSTMVFRGMVVVAIRADRLGDLADHAGFAELVQSHLLMLTPLGPAGARAVIEKPADQAGLILEPGLVEILVRDADGRALPLLSHVLRQVWSRREGRVMTVEGYQLSGSIGGAIAKTAEDVFASLSADEERMLRHILLRLVEASPDGALISRRVERGLVAPDDGHAMIVDRLVNARLLTADEESVQVSHEALAREWPRLKEWLQDDFEGQRIMRHLASAATAWDGMGRPESELYRGPRLSIARRWRESADPALSAVERDFLDHGVANEDATLRAAQRQLRKERRMVRRLSWLSAGAAGLAIAVIGAGLIAGWQADNAAKRGTVAEARRVAALALNEPELDRALLTAVEAIQLWDSPETRVNLVRVLSRAPRVVSIFRTDEPAPISMSLGADGVRASVIDVDADLRLFDLQDRSQLGEYSPFGGTMLASALDPASGDVAFSEGTGRCAGVNCEGTRIGTISLDGSRSGVVTYDGLATAPTDIEYSADGSLLAAVAPRTDVRSAAAVAVWKVAAASPGSPMIVDVSVVDPMADPGSLVGQPRLGFSPDGSRLYVGGFGPTVVLDTASGAEIGRVDGRGLLAVSPDGHRIAVRDGLLSVRIVDLSALEASATVPLSLVATDATFSPDGHQLAIATGTDVVVAEVESGEVTQTLREHDDTVTTVDFAPTGELVTSAVDGAILTWNLHDWWTDLGMTSSVRHSDQVAQDVRTVVQEDSHRVTRVITAEPTAWERRACELAGRALDAQEWEQLFGGRVYEPACHPGLAG
ncbi:MULTISPECIES: BTAD domain-containing putative transcriptional regulator [Microbacterium]|uniref:nSTAND1 domain-containing NTPase n=1 Tax=Microbacterium TaxID=33882 RepID=UPI000D65CB22|nr:MULTISPECIES: BTAD domain-containing putative transcriptional regulator [Microbacterium]